LRDINNYVAIYNNVNPNGTLRRELIAKNDY
jgi:hypothetical protein